MPRVEVLLINYSVSPKVTTKDEVETKGGCLGGLYEDLRGFGKDTHRRLLRVGECRQGP